jgi:hypothetical protein
MKAVKMPILFFVYPQYIRNTWFTAQQLRDSIDKWDLIKLKTFCSSKEMVSKLKRTLTE